VIPRPHEQLMRILPTMQPTGHAGGGASKGGSKTPD